jgi:tryptophan synthase alpha chain
VNRIAGSLAELRGQKKAGFIAYLTCGDPSMQVSAEAVKVLADAGADVIELGVPFSDPIADGPVIQRASARALAAGASLSQIVDMVAGLRGGGLKTPLILFGYYNPVLRFGPERLAREAAAAGADGLLVADLIPEEGADLAAACKETGLDRIHLVAPTTPDARIASIAGATGAFLYAVSLTGVTGAREHLPPGAAEFVKRIRAVTDKPLALGFGIGSPETAAAAARLADAVVVGSAIVRHIEENAGNPDLLRRLGSFVRELVEAAKSRRPGDSERMLR